jgi:hypothetical protein
MFRPTLLLAAVAALAVPALAQDDPARTERVQFERGASSAVLTGSITGPQSVDYVIGARAGQRVTVNLQTDTSTAFFNVMAPDATEAMFIGSMSGNRFSAVAPADGDYTVQIYLMRNAVRRNQTSNYTLTVAVR